MIDELVKGFEQAKSERLQVETIYKDCYDYSDALRGEGLLNGGAGRDMPTALVDANSTKVKKVYDPTLTDCVRQLRSSIISGMFPSSSRWFDIDVSQMPDFRDAWLDDSADTAWREIHAGNFDATVGDAIDDTIIGGHCVLYQDMDDEGALRFHAFPFAQCFVASSHPAGLVDTLYREFALTYEQAVAEYGEEAVRGLAAHKGSGKLLEFIWCIKPRPGATGASGMEKDLPYASVTWYKGDKTVVRESGYHEFPCAVARWKKLPNSAYGVGPVYEALPAAKTLNEMVKFHIQNAEMQMAGMWGAVDDGAINPGTVKIGPRQIVVMSQPNSLFPITPPGNINISIENISMQQAFVRKLMLVEGLALPQEPGVTATAINVQLELLRQQLGPMFGRYQFEMAQQIIRRAFGLLMRAGKIKPPPAEIAGKDLDIRYISPLARSQRSNEVAAMERYEQNLGMIMQVKPDVIDIYDADGAQREKSWLLGVPQKIMRKESEVKKLREERAKAQAAAAQKMQQMQAAGQTK